MSMFLFMVFLVPLTVSVGKLNYRLINDLKISIFVNFSIMKYYEYDLLSSPNKQIQFDHKVISY